MASVGSGGLASMSENLFLTFSPCIHKTRLSLDAENVGGLNREAKL